MPLQFVCPQCQQLTTVGDEMAGQVYTCTCGFMLRLALPEPPAAPAESPYTAPNLSGSENTDGTAATPGDAIPADSST